MNTVSSTDEVRPPMMARAMGVYCSPPSPSFIAIGIIPMMVASEVIRMGRRRTRQAVTMASVHRQSLLFELVREVDDQNAVGVRDADQHQHAHERHDVERGVSQRQNDQHADEAHRNRQHDQERIDPGLELGHQDQKQKNERNTKAEAEALEGLRPYC